MLQNVIYIIDTYKINLKNKKKVAIPWSYSPVHPTPSEARWISALFVFVPRRPRFSVLFFLCIARSWKKSTIFIDRHGGIVVVVVLFLRHSTATLDHVDSSRRRLLMGKKCAISVVVYWTVWSLNLVFARFVLRKDGSVFVFGDELCEKCDSIPFRRCLGSVDGFWIILKIIRLLWSVWCNAVGM